MLAEDMFAARGGGQAGAFPRVEVKYFPVNICPVDRSCFVLPAASATVVFFPSFKSLRPACDIFPLPFPAVSPLSYLPLSFPLPLRDRLLTHHLHHLSLGRCFLLPAPAYLSPTSTFCLWPLL